MKNLYNEYVEILSSLHGAQKLAFIFQNFCFAFFVVVVIFILYKVAEQNLMLKK